MSAIAFAPSREDRLIEEVAWLRRLLGFEIEAEKVARVAASFRLSKSEARVLLLLHARRGRLVSLAFFDEAMPVRTGAPPGKITSVRVMKIRRRLGYAAVSNNWGLGYSLPPPTIARIDALFEDL